MLDSPVSEVLESSRMEWPACPHFSSYFSCVMHIVKYARTGNEPFLFLKPGPVFLFQLREPFFQPAILFLLTAVPAPNHSVSLAMN